MNRIEKLGLVCFLLAMFNALGHRIEDEFAPWYALVFLVGGLLLFLFGDEK